MKKLFLALTIAAASFTFTACSDTPEKLVDDMVNGTIKCLLDSQDDKVKANKCLEKNPAYEERLNKFSKEEQKWIQEQTWKRFWEEAKRIDDEEKAKKAKEKKK